MHNLKTLHVSGSDFHTTQWDLLMSQASPEKIWIMIETPGYYRDFQQYQLHNSKTINHFGGLFQTRRDLLLSKSFRKMIRNLIVCNLIFYFIIVISCQFQHYFICTYLIYVCNFLYIFVFNERITHCLYFRKL